MEQDMNDGLNENNSIPRLIIIKMVLENFKSYAGKKEIGPFHKCFSAVIGPNGSGKSNVIDALLFVFGKRAKRLRLNKVSELVHHSTGFPNLESTQVSIYFQDIIDLGDGDNEYKVVDNSEINISRSANIYNQSKYYINGISSTFTQVITILKKRGIDLDNNRFLILQGEVEQISMMKPKSPTTHEEGLLEYLEDIIGSNIYINEIEKTSNDIDTVYDEKENKKNKVIMIEKEKSNLENAKNEAQNYLNKEIELNEKKNILYQIYYNETNNNSILCLDKKQQLYITNEKKEKELENLNNKLNDMEKKYDILKKEQNDIYNQLNNNKQKFSNIEKIDINTREEISYIKKSIKKLKNDIDSENKNKQILQEKSNNNINSIIPELENNTIPKLNNLIQKEEIKYEKIFQDSKNQTHEIRIENEKLEKIVHPLRKELNLIKSDIETKKTEINLIEKKKNNVMKLIESFKKKKHEIIMRDNEIKEQEKNINDNIYTLENNLKSIDDKINDLKNNEIDISKKLNEIRPVYEKKNSIYINATMNDTGTNSRQLRKLMDAVHQENGELHNCVVFGRLGDLGTIDSKYDVAITTACGGVLNNIVVNGTKDAQECVSFLKRNNLGRQTFIILDKIQYLSKAMCNHFNIPKPNRSMNTKNDSQVERLFDLIKINNEKFRVAFYFALRNTLVTSNIDTASNVAYGSGNTPNRVVTLDGQLIESSGTMAGGGGRPRSGGMNSGNTNIGANVSVTKEEIQEMEEKISALSRELRNVQEKIRSLENEKNEIKSTIDHRHNDKRKIEMEKNSNKDRLNDIDIKLNENEPKNVLNNDEKEKIDKLLAIIDDLQIKYDEIKPKVIDIDNKLKKNMKNIMDIGGDKLQEQKNVITNLNKKLQKETENLAKAKLEINTNNKKIQNIDEMLNRSAKDLQLNEEKLVSNMDIIKKNEDDAIEITKKIEELTKLHEIKKKQLIEEEKLNQPLRKNLAEIKSEIIDINDNLEDCETKYQESIEKKNHWQNKIQQLHRQFLKEQEEYKKVLLTCNDNEHSEESSDEEKLVDHTLNEPEKTSSDGDKDKEKKETEILKILSKKLEMIDLENLNKYDKDDIKYDISIAEQERDQLRKDVNMGALAAYHKKEKEYIKKLKEYKNCITKYDNIKKHHDLLRSKRLLSFMEGFNMITFKLKEMYQMITLGGDAELEIVDSSDPFAEGIVFSVRPSKKSWKNICNLSGGEKTLASLALVFALHHYKPTPLYVMDEIDAALDFKNVSIVGNYIKEQTKNAQFIIISLRNNMFELADRLIGIYKTKDSTKSLTVNPNIYEKTTKNNNNDKSRHSSTDTSYPLADKTNILNH